mgnify:CR=1 FL=1
MAASSAPTATKAPPIASLLAVNEAAIEASTPPPPKRQKTEEQKTVNDASTLMKKISEGRVKGCSDPSHIQDATAVGTQEPTTTAPQPPTTTAPQPPADLAARWWALRQRYGWWPRQDFGLTENYFTRIAIVRHGASRGDFDFFETEAGQPQMKHYYSNNMLRQIGGMRHVWEWGMMPWAS